jgi:HK97 family phage portal protein
MRKVAEFGNDWTEVTDDHPVLRLFSRANPFLNGFDATALRIIHGELAGNAYLHPVLDANLGVPSELWLMPPQWVTIIPDPIKFIRAYKYGAPGATDIEFQPEEVIHFKRPHPSNLYYGMGKVEAAWGAVQANQALHDMDHAMFKNRARPDYVGTVKGNPSDEEMDRLEVAIKETLRGTDKTGKFILTSADLTLQPMSFPPKDLTGRDEIVEEIAAIFGVPVSMLKTNDPNLASAQTGFAQWREGTIAPLLRMDEETLNQRLLPMFGIEGEAVLAYDDPVRANEQYELSARSASVAGGWRTPNEARAEEGLEPIDTAAANELRGLPIALPPAPAPAPMYGASIAPDVLAAKSCACCADADGVKKNDEPIEPVAKRTKQVSQRDLWTKAKQPISSAALDAFTRSVDEVFAGQIRDVVKIINAEPVPTESTLARVLAMLKQSRNDPRLANAMIPYIEESVRSGMALGTRTLEAQIGTRLPVSIGMSSDNLDKYVQQATTRLVSNSVNGIRSEFTVDVRALLRNGLDEGLDNAQLAKTVQDWAAGEPDDERTTQWRALRVARTEAMRGHQTAQLDAWTETGLVTGKQWILAPDACEFCEAAAAAYGEGSHAVDEPFFAKGSALEGADGGVFKLDYEDIYAPPLHPNCRCDLIPVLVDDYQKILEGAVAEAEAYKPSAETIAAAEGFGT